MWEEHLKRLTLFGLVSALSICQIAYASDVATDSNAVRVEDDVGADNKEEEQTGNKEEQTGNKEEQTGDEELINDLDYSGVYVDNGAEQIDINSLNDATVYGATETSETTTENNVAVKVPYIVRIDGNGIKTAFEIKVIGTLNETSTLYVYLDESVELTTYLKDPIYGTVTQDKYSVNSSDLEVGGGTDIINADITLEKYITAGEWKGNLGIEVYLEDLGTTETLEASTFVFDVPEIKEEITEGTAEMDGELEKTESGLDETGEASGEIVEDNNLPAETEGENMELESLPDESEAGNSEQETESSEQETENSEQESLPAETEAESSEQETGSEELITDSSLPDETEGEELGTESIDTESTNTESTDTESLPEETEETVESTEETESDYMEEEIIDIPDSSLPEETSETDSGTTDTENEATSDTEEVASEEASDVSETTL